MHKLQALAHMCQSLRIQMFTKKFKVPAAWQHTSSPATTICHVEVFKSCLSPHGLRDRVEKTRISRTAHGHTAYGMLDRVRRLHRGTDVLQHAI